jgi:hypothetical protein
MDAIKFEIRENCYSKQGMYAGVDIFINGKNMLDIMSEIETPQAIKDGYFSRIGHYIPIAPEDLLNELENCEEEETTILGCPCGAVDCDPVWVQIDVTEKEVTWHDFIAIHKEWDYSFAPTYIFDIQQYNKEVEKLREYCNRHNRVEFTKNKNKFKITILPNGKAKVEYIGTGKESTKFTYQDDDCIKF